MIKTLSVKNQVQIYPEIEISKDMHPVSSFL